MCIVISHLHHIANINLNLTTHIARKTFATTVMLANGANIGVVSRLLGHSDVRITLEAYGTFQDQLMIADVCKIRKRIIGNE
jgi:site-specific recombinase XerD